MMRRTPEVDSVDGLLEEVSFQTAFELANGG